jgi:hypothetical protein
LNKNSLILEDPPHDNYSKCVIGWGLQNRGLGGRPASPPSPLSVLPSLDASFTPSSLAELDDVDPPGPDASFTPSSLARAFALFPANTAPTSVRRRKALIIASFLEAIFRSGFCPSSCLGYCLPPRTHLYPLQRRSFLGYVCGMIASPLLFSEQDSRPQVFRFSCLTEHLLFVEFSVRPKHGLRITCMYCMCRRGKNSMVSVT